MDNELSEKATVDSMELLTYFTYSTKSLSEKVECKSTIITSLDIVTAVYYFRSHPNASAFIEKFLATNTDYFLLQWVRSTWDRLSTMSEEEISNLVIKEVGIVSNAENELV